MDIGNKKVLVGLSGGVDSSVACLLLKEQKYSVEAVFIKVWQPDFIECNWREEMRDAMRVCTQLQIPFHFLDLEKEYKKRVADYFINEYKTGRTPNPDVVCNKYIKFGHMFDYAKKKGFDFVATGHYVRNLKNKLFRGKDLDKDQSYFLWSLTKNRLNKILFPVGDLNKEEVRKIAKKHNLFNSTKKDSQGICILGPINMKDFLKKYIDVKKGDVLDKSGSIIGTHEGAILYTIGERHGFTIDKKHKSSSDKTLYVIEKDVAKNIIIVSTRNEKREVRNIELKDVSFIDKEVEGEIEIQTRYRQKPQKGILLIDKREKREVRSKKWKLEANFEEDPAVGQSVVFYKGDECLGGGIIDKIFFE